MRTLSAFLGRLLVLLLAALANGSVPARAEEPPDAGEGVHGRVVTGRVVDGDGEGVAGARVAWFADAPAGDRSRAQAQRTDAEGRFRLAVEDPADEDVRGTIHVTRGDEAAVIQPVRVASGGGEHDAGTFRLEPARALEVDVRHGDVAVPGAEVWLWIWTGDLYGGVAAHLGTATTDEAGRAWFGAVPHAYVKLLVRAPDGALGERTRQVVPGEAASRIRVGVAPPRSVRVRVVDDADPSLPLAGAEVTRELSFALEDVLHRIAVHLPERLPPTADDGTVQVDGLLADRAVEVVARVAGRPLGRTRCWTAATEATIVVPGPTRIPVGEGERPVPPAGTRLRIWPRRPVVPPVEGWMVDGHLAVPLAERQVDPAIAVAPDGSIAPVDGLAPTSLVRPRSLVVRLLDTDGKAIVGAQVALWTHPYRDGPWEVPRATDPQGRVRFEGLAPSRHVLHGFALPGRAGGQRLAEVDLGPGDVVRDVVVGTERTLRVRVSVDGRPSLPPSAWWGVVDSIVVASTIDRASGSVVLRVRPQEGAPLEGSMRVGGEGVRSRDLTFTWPRGEETVEIDASLRRAPEIVADVREDSDLDTDVYVEKWGGWGGRGPWLASHETYPHLRGRTRLDLRAGRYRLHDLTTGIVSEPFDVPEHGGSVHAVIDLTNLVTIRGRIECPEASDDTRLWIGVEGEGIDGQFEFPVPHSGLRRRGLPCEGGAFVVHVPSGRPITLRPWHDTFQPAREGGEITLVGPQDDVVLRMGHGATVRMTLTGPDGEPLPPDVVRRPSVAAVPSGYPSRPAVLATASPVEGSPGTVSVSGLPFGTLDLWVATDPSADDGYAAGKWARARIDQDVVDLGACRLTSGSRVVIRTVEGDRHHVALDDSQSRACGLFGLRQWVPVRRSAAGPDAVGEFTGLGAGRWHITVEGTRQTARGGVPVRRTFEIDVDGEQDQTLDVDFRE